MELFSQPFVEAVRALFDLSTAIVLASVPVARQKRIPFVEEIKSRTDVTLIEVCCQSVYKMPISHTNSILKNNGEMVHVGLRANHQNQHRSP